MNKNLGLRKTFSLVEGCQVSLRDCFKHSISRRGRLKNLLQERDALQKSQQKWKKENRENKKRIMKSKNKMKNYFGKLKRKKEVSK